MIFDFLTVLFLISGLLLIYQMVRQRRRDVLHRGDLRRSEASSPAKRPAMLASSEGTAQPTPCPASLASVTEELSRIIRDLARDDNNRESR